MFTDVPVDPDRETAHQWARDELAKTEYQQGTGTNWLARFIEWIQNLISDLGGGFGGAWGGWGLLAVVAIAAAIIGFVVWLVVGPLRRSRGRALDEEPLGDPTLTVAELAALARSSAAEGRWDDAVIQGFRALIRALEEREAIATRPGMTALEASLAAGIAIPAIASDIAADSEVFDAVRYGHLAATAEHYAHVVATREAAVKARIEVLA